MSWRQTFAKMIGVPEHQAEDALRSERAARATLTRRNLFAGGAALAANSVFSFPAAPAPSVAFPPIPFGATWYPYVVAWGMHYQMNFWRASHLHSEV